MSCIFCKIVSGEIPAKKAYEDDTVLAFYDLDPQAPVHVLIIPKEHIESVNALEEQHKAVVFHVFQVAKQLAKTLNIAESGYRLVENTGRDGGQSVLHLHMHLLGGRSLQWPPG